MAQLLVVDDDADILDFMSAALRHAGYAVSTAVGGWDAAAQIKTEPPVMVVSDVRMLKGDGIELLETIQAMPTPQGSGADWLPPVLLVSGYDVGSAEVLDRGAVGLLTKPF